MKAWTIIISSIDGGAMWMNTEEAHSAEEATVQGLATYISEGHYDTDEVADVITIPGSLQDEATWQVFDRDRQSALLNRAARIVADGEEVAR